MKTIFAKPPQEVCDILSEKLACFNVEISHSEETETIDIAFTHSDRKTHLFFAISVETGELFHSFESFEGIDCETQLFLAHLIIQAKKLRIAV